MEKINNMFAYIDKKVGPSKKDHKPACYEDREMLMECVLQSNCFKNNENFKYCIQDGIDKECKSLRYNYKMCKRAQVFWAKSFSRDDPR